MQSLSFVVLLRSKGPTVSRGLFITLEGSEGSGKSTMLQVLAKDLTSRGFEVVTTREPGGTTIAEQIRSILLTKQDEKLCDMSELFLMYAARIQHVEHLIKPALAAGKMVLSDRFDLSSIAYQGVGRGIELATISKVRSLAIADFRPDLTLLLDVDVNLGMQRVTKRGAKDRFEQEQISFFERIRQAYLDYAHSHPQEVSIIDCNRDLASVQTDVLAQLYTKLTEHGYRL